MILYLFVFLAVCVLSDTVNAQTAKNLHEVLQNSMDSQSWVYQQEQNSDILGIYTSSPYIQTTYLNGNNEYGSDEFEIMISFPFKNIKQIQLEKIISQNIDETYQLLRKNNKLYISGLIREALWNYLISNKKLQIEKKKQDWLLQQENVLRELVNTNSISSNSLIYIQSRILQSRIGILDLTKQAAASLQSYKRITGSDKLPENKTEVLSVQTSSGFNNHPAVQLLNMAMQQSETTYQLSGTDYQPWTVSATAKEIKTSGFTDKQYGLQLQLPLSFSNKKTLADNAIWVAEQNNLSREIYELNQQLTSKREQLENEYEYLTEKQQLLSEQSELTRKIIDNFNALKSHNEISLDLYFQRITDIQDSLYEQELNQLYIYQNISRQNQLTGVAL